jgi:Tol biopolymer transport system component
MKKIFKSALILTFFAVSLLLFQMSCKKTVDAQQNGTYILPIASPTTLGGVKPDGTTILVDPSGKISIASQNLPQQSDVILYKKYIPGPSVSTVEFWLCDKNGSNKRQIVVPSNLTIQDFNMSLLADQNTVVFPATEGNGTSNLYTMNIDGSNIKKIVGDGVNNYYEPQAYH